MDSFDMKRNMIRQELLITSSNIFQIKEHQNRYAARIPTKIRQILVTSIRWLGINRKKTSKQAVEKEK